eukprot:2144309-Karenia_brevis.AAC.1
MKRDNNPATYQRGAKGPPVKPHTAPVRMRPPIPKIASMRPTPADENGFKFMMFDMREYCDD